MSHPDHSQQLVRNARREAWIVAWVWAVALVWTVAWYYLFGYQHDETSLAVQLGLADAGPAVQPTSVLGFPSWVFWGIIVPWLACSAFTVWFGMRGIADDDLGTETHEDGERHGH
jgi:hypothetical protein